MECNEAQRAIESLRMGLPPDGNVRQFTVGRGSEIDALIGRLDQADPGALLLKANYGSGKSHLLRFIRETALQRRFAVSSVTLDCRSAIRFNRMDQILGAIWRGLELPHGVGVRGCRGFLDWICTVAEARKSGGDDIGFWKELTDNWKWSRSQTLQSPSLFIAIRAWATGRQDTRLLIESWLQEPWNYYARRTDLYQKLVADLYRYFRDPRPDWEFYDTREGVFNFQLQSYQQSWDCLSDMHVLAREAGLRGFVLLFDEFEDVLNNMTRIDFQEAAFKNLFQFFGGKRFPGMSFFAVTPAFVMKCKERLLQKGRWDFDYARLDSLPTFEMSPLTAAELQELSDRILRTHADAYAWNPLAHIGIGDLRAIVERAAKVPIQDRARQTIRQYVATLDRLLEGSE